MVDRFDDGAAVGADCACLACRTANGERGVAAPAIQSDGSTDAIAIPASPSGVTVLTLSPLRLGLCPRFCTVH